MLTIVSTEPPPIASRMALAQALRERRAELGVTQMQLAIAAGVGRGVVQKLETGRGTVTLDSALAIVAALSLDLHLARRGAGPRDGG